MYKNLDAKSKEIVMRRLQWRILTDLEPYDEKKYDEYCMKYLSDEIKDRYVIRTRWSITASKFKTFMNNPQEYYLRYVLELPEPTKKERKCFTTWNAFETIVSDGIEWFEKKYYIDKWYLKEELAIQLSEWDEDVKKLLMKSNLETLREQYYKPWEKVRLTNAEGRNIIAMRYETQRQPIFEMWSDDYEDQVYFEAKYMDLKISWTLDRYSKKLWKIRDWKTSWQFDKFQDAMEYEYDYITSMAFYYALVYVQDWVECDVYLDVQESTDPYRSEVYKLWSSRLNDVMKNKVKPGLIALNNAHATNERPQVDRDTALKSPYYTILQTVISQPQHA